MARSQAGSPAFRRLPAPNAVTPIRAFNKYENIPGFKLFQDEGVMYRREEGTTSDPWRPKIAVSSSITTDWTGEIVSGVTLVITVWMVPSRRPVSKKLS